MPCMPPNLNTDPHPFTGENHDAYCRECGGSRTDGLHLRWLAANPTPVEPIVKTDRPEHWPYLSQGESMNLATPGSTTVTPDVELPPLGDDEPDDGYHAIALELSTVVAERDARIRDLLERAQVRDDERRALEARVEDLRGTVAQQIEVIVGLEERERELNRQIDDLDEERAVQVVENAKLRDKLHDQLQLLNEAKPAKRSRRWYRR